MSDLGHHGAAFGARAAAAALQASASTSYAPLPAATALPATWKRAVEATSFVQKLDASKSSSSSSSSAAPPPPSRLKPASMALSRSGNHRLSGGNAQPPLAPPPPKTSLATQARRGVSRVIQSKVLTAIMVFLFTMVALLFVNPPMARDPHDPRVRSWRKMVTWSFLAFAAALALPWCFPTAQVVI